MFTLLVAGSCQSKQWHVNHVSLSTPTRIFCMVSSLGHSPLIFLPSVWQKLLLTLKLMIVLSLVFWWITSRRSRQVSNDVTLVLVTSVRHSSGCAVSLPSTKSTSNAEFFLQVSNLNPIPENYSLSFFQPHRFSRKHFFLKNIINFSLFSAQNIFSQFNVARFLFVNRW